MLSPCVVAPRKGSVDWNPASRWKLRRYPDWIFDGNDILLLVRIAFGRSYNFHDANYQCFFRIENYLQYLQ